MRERNTRDYVQAVNSEYSRCVVKVDKEHTRKRLSLYLGRGLQLEYLSGATGMQHGS